MIMFLRSLAFNGFFYAWTLLCCIVFLPVLVLPRSFVLQTTKMWIYGVVWICEHILGLYIKVIGKERLLISPVIFAIKHQSAWETLIFHYFLVDSSIALKKELLWIPFFGLYIKKLEMIPLSRSQKNGIQDLKNLLKEGDKAISKGRPIVIFPEGTRSKPGQKTTYHSGIASLYRHLQIPVVPVAHDAGLYWPRRGFMKKPGCITLEFLEPILPGLSRKEFMTILENRIETKMNEIIPKEIIHDNE
jgi:1-acyl-sn-glycerol-3-phosphate acyltransferase